MGMGAREEGRICGQSWGLCSQNAEEAGLSLGRFRGGGMHDHPKAAGAVPSPRGGAGQPMQ